LVRDYFIFDVPLFLCRLKYIVFVIPVWQTVESSPRGDNFSDEEVTLSQLVITCVSNTNKTIHLCPQYSSPRQ
jgi:hypothetical protein